MIAACRQIALVLVVVTVLYPSGAFGADNAVAIPPPSLDKPKAQGPVETAVIAGGCFWGVQGVYQHVRGVQSVLSGYSGGSKATANYDRVSRGDTGHAEAVEIRFDPKDVSYGEILQCTSPSRKIRPSWIGRAT